MAELVGAELHVLTVNRPRLIRYLELGARTVRLLVQRRPNVLFCQNPSIVLAVLAVVLKPFFRYQLVVDQHNAGIQPLDGRSVLLQRMANFVKRRATISIVSNRELVEDVQSHGGHAVVCPDPLPVPGTDPVTEDARRRIESERPYILVVCSWSEDEPYEEILAAAELVVDLGVDLLFTGHPKPSALANGRPANVRFLGFVPDPDYDALMVGALSVIVLTTRQSCLNCGAYEAVASGVPPILSDTTALRGAFAPGAVFTTNQKRSIARAIRVACSESSRLRQLLPATYNSLNQSVSEALDVLEQDLRKR
ncbi:glycosyltransferase family 4 protein [Aquisalimonas sp. 2447]|uniref:glycosyltransferase n=1 Tax=Aquisalimonas sp. 2447 TaxID=2740807 RepID=UPI0014325B5E|nr:glycosyltransferase [Aquisalimonas sp. 2447]QIT56569.1 glycosyltransferase family 4 protein [Aquisalimonas sp. 2447]